MVFSSPETEKSGWLDLLVERINLAKNRGGVKGRQGREQSKSPLRLF